MTDRTRKHRDGSVTIYTKDMGSIGGLEPDDVAPMKQAIEDVRRQGPCLKCGHLACPFCMKWCDVITDDQGSCCDGECSYAPSECKRCGFVVCSCTLDAAIAELAKTVAEPAPAPELEQRDDPPDGYTPLYFEPVILLARQSYRMRQSPQRPLCGPYLLQLTLRTEEGELMPLELQQFEIDCCLVAANFGNGAEVPDEARPGIAPTSKRCIPLDGPPFAPAGYAAITVVNPTQRAGVLRATLYGRRDRELERSFYVAKL